MVNFTPVEVSVNECVDLSKVPLSALNHRSYQLLSALLNKTKIFKSEDGYYRDWRGLFQVLKLEHYHKAELDKHINPTKRVLDLWQESLRGANLKELQHVLGQIDRWDILDDSNKLLCEDAEKFMANQSNEVNITDAADNSTSLVSDEDIITKDDTRHKKQSYDAFILFADADIEFATKIMERMEERKLKLCVKDRDLLAGINFEHDAIIKLISERCRRLVVVISKEFLKSPLHNFFVMFAQALQIEQKKRKIIPCVYERLELPANLKFYFILDYKRSNKLYNFWDKLEDAIKARTDSPVIENINQTKEAEVDNIPNIKVDDIEEISLEETDPLQAKKVPNIVEADTASCKSDFEQPIKKSLSSWDISHAFNRVLTNKCKNSSSSTSELRLRMDSTDQELKKAKWYTKLGLSSSKSSLDGTGERSEKKKSKWYKSSKKMATAM
ncbi:myeloid differentiation primary response protein MyD88 [Ochlerotatus camptorhynchus]|uniref:myeloid differentiation primary response protein MyD88 n=1 Tax=Ochlerotatus camptorhynchus TaxID=644619 RepID=UPI0031E3883C